MVGMWGQLVAEETNELLRQAGADEILNSVTQAAERIRTRAPMLIAVNPPDESKTELVS